MEIWPSTQDHATNTSGVALLLLQGLAAAVITGLILGSVFWSVTRIFRSSATSAMTIGGVLGFNAAVIALFWLLPMLM